MAGCGKRLHARNLETFPARASKSLLFPQPSTTKISVIVTNNLDRGFQTVQARYMREGSSNQFSTTAPRSGSRSASNSLFHKILAVSPCGSRFCSDSILSPPRKFLRIRILEKGKKKIWGGAPRQDSPGNATRSAQRSVHLARISLDVHRLRVSRDGNLRTPVCPSLSPDGTIHLYA